MTENGFNLETTPALKTLIEDLIAELKVAFNNLPQQP
jgi:hypothetical protein